MTKRPPVPPSQFKLLSTIFNNRSLFNRQDNTFKFSNRGAADKLSISASSVDQLMRTLKQEDLIRRVTTISGSEIMLSPKFLKARSMEHGRYWFAMAIYYLRYHHKAVKWYYDCFDIGSFIHPETGEIIESVSLSDRLSFDLLRSRQYKDKQIHYKINLPQGYTAPVTPILLDTKSKVKQPYT